MNVVFVVIGSVRGRLSRVSMMLMVVMMNLMFCVKVGGIGFLSLFGVFNCGWISFLNSRL